MYVSLRQTQGKTENTPKNMHSIKKIEAKYCTARCRTTKQENWLLRTIYTVKKLIHNTKALITHCSYRATSNPRTSTRQTKGTYRMNERKWQPSWRSAGQTRVTVLGQGRFRPLATICLGNRGSRPSRSFKLSGSQGRSKLTLKYVLIRQDC